MVDRTIQGIRDNYGSPSAVSDSDLTEVSQSGATKAVSFGEIFTFINGKTFTGPVLQRYSETTATTTATVDRSAGGVQTLTLTANSTLDLTIADGESLLLIIKGGDTYTLDWSTNQTITWIGGSVPTLAAETHIEFLQVGTVIYGYIAGDV